ncbi:MAG: zinc ribbon domain-containing protein [Gemmatimonadota bacterium]
MTDLERFFRRLVDNLIAIDPARLHRPVSIEEIAQTIVPYRTNRRALELESNEDYDMVLLRLCAGEGGFVRTDPPEAQAAFVEETASLNPDLSVLRQLQSIGVLLATEQLAYALGPEPGMAYAPREDDNSPDPGPNDRPALTLKSVRWPRATIEPVIVDDDSPEVASAMAGTADRCSYCGGTLPTNRAVNFCPHCGESQSLGRCPSCQAEVELGWKHCVTCGAPVAEA